MEKYTMSHYLSKDDLYKQMSKDIYEIYKTANNTLYFNDRSDYKTALWEIIKIIEPQIDEYKELEYIN